MKKIISDFVLREWLLLLSLSGLLATSYYLQALPLYTQKELVPIFFLFCLFVVIKGVENSNLLLKIAVTLESGNFLPLKLVSITFLLSMIVTIDVALVTMLPIVLSLKVKQRQNLTILVALTAHVGAALTPFGTPQNLFIYTFYEVNTYTFIQTIAPFSVGMFLIFVLISFFMKLTTDVSYERKEHPVHKKFALSYLLLLVIVILSVLRILPAWVAGVSILFALLFDRKSLKIDYALLLTFLIFLGLTSNIKIIITTMIDHPGHIFILSAVMSQFISNVPTTLLLNKFTTQWEALLWGTNVGGFGSLVAALANLITYKIYIAYGDKKQTKRFVAKFIFAGYLAFALGFALFFLTHKLSTIF
ncbi:SLC13 family permease [Sulfurimonas sp.]